MFTSALTQFEKTTLLQDIPSSGRLNRECVDILLERASTQQHPQARAIIQCRLGDAIEPGTPRMVHDQLDKVFTQAVQAGTLQTRANEIWALVSGHHFPDSF